METIETHGDYTLSLEHDQDCESPLENDPGVCITYRAGARTCIGNTPLDQEAHAEVAARIESGELIGLPVYAYVHSGIALSTGPFSCPWDSGQSGFIYVDRATALEWQGGKILTAKRRAATLRSLEGVLSAYGDWINGDCYGFIIERAGEHVDSCWGFIGYKYAKEEGRDALAARIACDEKASTQETRERNYWAARDVITI